jgi:dihydrofolate synthase/folylpolyglutamate synthase
MNPAELKPLHQALGGLDASVIHIAGSKGKGTTATLLAKILEMNGKRVGLFTSPAVMDVEEMISVNGKCVTTLELQNLLDRVRELGVKLSVFEEQTLAALLYFQEQHCDYVVLECGWGGRDDATNLVENKVLTLLTHVELEHTDVLGKTLEEITVNKLGICRPGVPLLTVPTQSEEVLRTIASAGQEPLIAGSYEVGHHHPESAGLAIMAADLLGCSIDSVLHEALANLVIPGRFEIIQHGNHTLILDGAHTYDSIEYFLQRANDYAWQHELPEPFFAIHVLKDKRADLWELFPRNRTVWVPLVDERAGTRPEGLSEKPVEEIFEQLRVETLPQLVVFCGSFKLVAAVKRVLRAA